MNAPTTRPLKRFLDPKLLGRVVLVGLVAVGVKAVGFVKELVVAHRFGVSDEVDAFLVAFMIATTIAFIVGDAFRDAVVPAYTKLRVARDPNAAKLVSNTLWICAAMTLVVSLCTVTFGGTLIAQLAQNFSPEKQGRSVFFLRLLFPFALCFGTASILRGYLQTHHRFAFSSAAAAAIPLTTIVVLLLTPGWPSGALLAIGASLGAVLFAAILCVDCRKVPDETLLNRPGSDDSTRSMLRLTIPLLAGTAVMESCFFVDTMMATSLAPGSVATLNYGERICMIVLAIAGTATSQALFPYVSKLVAEEAWDALAQVTLRFSALILALALPFVLLFWFAAEPIVRLLFERGEFTPEDTVRVAEVLRVAAFQIPGYILAVLGGRVVMALGASRFLLLTTLVALGLNIALNLLFIRWIGLKGIALATAVVTLNSALMLYLFCAIRIRKLAAGKPTAV